jgi:hypothetical protein
MQKIDVLLEDELHTPGSFSLSPEHVSLHVSFDIRERDTLYFHYANSDSKPQNIRVCLLRDWIQIPWPSSGELFIDTVLRPHERLVERIDLNKVIKEEPMQLTAIWFIDPYALRFIMDESGQIQSKTTIFDYFCQTKRIIVLK